VASAGRSAGRRSRAGKSPRAGRSPRSAGASGALLQLISRVGGEFVGLALLATSFVALLAYHVTRKQG